MIRYSAHWWFCLFAGALVFLLFSFRPVHAAEEKGVTIFGITQQDLNNDGRPDLTIIDCAFATSHDRIYIYDRGNDMPASSDWREASDFTDDVWLYDIGADDSIQLIVVYGLEYGRNTAYVYDDQDGDGQVKYERTGNTIKILESPYWTARIASDSTWYLPDGRLNLNVRFDLDGSFPTLDRAPQAYVQGWMKHDGLIDVELEEVAGVDGVAQYALKRLLTDSPFDWSFERSGLQSNEGRYSTGLYDLAFFQFLPIPIAPQDPQYVNLRYFDLPPRLTLDWIHGKVLAVGLDGYPIGHGYHFNDNMYINKGQVNDVSFESPQAYYDLADNHDAFAEMHIRFFTHPSGDATTWSFNNMQVIPWQSISYDWNLFNPGTLRWDFKVGLGGNYEINTVVNFRDFAVRTVPFEQLPYWITEREWKMTTFVAREGEGYQSSEGIYEWQTDTGDNPENNPASAFKAREATHGYMLGINTSPPDNYFQTTLPGFRAERHFASPVQPYLYFSPIDHKLHLRGAEAGIWTIDGQHSIRYADLDGDSYLDQWQYFENGKLLRQFYVAGSYLLYAGEDGVWLKKVDLQRALFQVLPPRNHEDWLSLRQQLEANQPRFAPADFKAMLDQFAGQVWHLEGVTLHDFRPDGKGYRFILESSTGYQVRHMGDPDSNLQPDDAYTFSPLTPPILSASLVPLTPIQLQLNPFSISLNNDGLEDVPQAVLELWATSPEGHSSIVVTQTVSLLAQTPITPSLLWAPPSSGVWILTPKIHQLNGQVFTGDAAKVSVRPAREVVPGVLVLSSTTIETLPFTLFGLVVFATIAALTSWLYLEKTLRGRSE